MAYFAYKSPPEPSGYKSYSVELVSQVGHETDEGTMRQSRRSVNGFDGCGMPIGVFIDDRNCDPVTALGFVADQSRIAGKPVQIDGKNYKAVFTWGTSNRSILLLDPA